MEHRSWDRKKKEELEKVAEQELFEVRRIAKEFSEKRKIAKLEHKKWKAQAMEKGRSRHAKIERQRWTREAELMRLIKEDEERSRLRKEKIRKLEEEICQNWSERASENSESFDSTVPREWLNRKTNKEMPPSTSKEL